MESENSENILKKVPLISKSRKSENYKNIPRNVLLIIKSQKTDEFDNILRKVLLIMKRMKQQLSCIGMLRDIDVLRHAL